MRIIAGKFKGRIIDSPKGMGIRPTSSRLREAFFSIVQAEIADMYFLDLFAGSGAMGIEAISRGAAHATFVEKERRHSFLIEKNLHKLGIQKPNEAAVYCSDATLFIRSALPHFSYDCIYIDPPYGRREDTANSFLVSLLLGIERSSLIKQHTRIFLEERQGVKIPLPLFSELTLFRTRNFGSSQLLEFHKCGL